MHPDEGAGATPTADPQNNGVVIAAGRFPSGGVVKCWHVSSEAVLRVDADAVLVGERVVDDSGNVGFPGLVIGERYILSGYVDGRYTEVRAIGEDPAALDSPLSQPPVQPLPATVGTQEAKVTPTPPAPPADPLPVGTADLPAAAVPETAPNGPYRFLLEGTPPEAFWTPADVEIPDGAAPEGASTALWTYTGDSPLTTTPDGFALWTGATVSTANDAPPPLPPAPTSVPSGAPVAQDAPPAPDAGEPNASESSGTGQANGGAVEQAPGVSATASGGTGVPVTPGAAVSAEATQASPAPTEASQDIAPAPAQGAPEANAPAAAPTAPPSSAPEAGEPAASSDAGPSAQDPAQTAAAPSTEAQPGGEAPPVADGTAPQVDQPAAPAAPEQGADPATPPAES